MAPDDKSRENAERPEEGKMKEKHGGWVFRGSADAEGGGKSAELMAEELKLLDGRKGEKLMKDECA
jgi:hypothetical protein